MKKYFKKFINKKIFEKILYKNNFIIFFSNLFINLIAIKNNLITKAFLINKYSFLKKNIYIYSNLKIAFFDIKILFLKVLNLLNNFILFIFFNHFCILKKYLFLIKINITNFFLLKNYFFNRILNLTFLF